MKKLKYIFISLLILIIIVPIIFFDFEENKASEIDNRMLNELTDFKIDIIENYVSDRIGFRSYMINAYNSINKELFGVSTNPELLLSNDRKNYLPKSYSVVNYGEYHEKLANAIKDIQDYCEERGIAFYYVINPSKLSIYPELLPDGINYDISGLEDYIKVCSEKGINVIDNYKYLKSIKDDEKIYNETYDTFHWNDLGAFYGINNVLNVISKDFEEVSVNLIEDYDINESNYNGEIVEELNSKVKSNDLTKIYSSGLYLNEEFNDFSYYSSDKNNITLLSFEGSFFLTNDRTEKFLSHRFGNTIAIHDYQNIFNIKYYLNIYNPDIVIFEMADYTFAEYYFASYGMETMSLQPLISSLNYQEELVGELEYQVKDEGEYRNILISLPWDVYDYVYLQVNGKTYDVYKFDNETVALTVLKDEKIDFSEIIIKTYKKGDNIIKTYTVK